MIVNFVFDITAESGVKLPPFNTKTNSKRKLRGVEAIL